MTIDVLDRTAAPEAAQAAELIVDCDIHPRPRSKEQDIFPHLEQRWRDQIRVYGTRPKIGNVHGRAFPKGQPAASRRDSWPPNGARPGSDLDFLRKQLLEEHHVGLGILNFAGENGQNFQNQELGAAYTSAVNDWLKTAWTSKEPRLKASIVVAYESPAAAVGEIERWAGDDDFIQVLMHSRSAEPFGRQSYWPIYEAAEAAGLPVGIHAFGYGGNPITSSGWPSFYIEEMIGHSQCCQALLTSMVLEGVFETFPNLKLVLMESGFAWMPSLCSRLDKVWTKCRGETPRVKRPPSEYIHDHVWFTTQPIEEPEERRHLIDLIEFIGWDRLLFSTDYPHWDFDDPDRTLPPGLSREQRRGLLRDNALALYRRSL